MKYSYGRLIFKMGQKDRFQLRYEMCVHATRYGIKCAAREFHCSRNTVRLWLKRYKKEGLSGIKEVSRKPHLSPNKCSEEFEQKVIALRLETNHRFSARRLVQRHNLEFKKKCVGRIIKQYGFARNRKKKYEKQNQLRAVKRVYKAFEKIQVDVKDLKDIAHYWPQMRSKGLPTFEITARDVKTGATFVCLAYKNNSNNAASFLVYLLEHLSQFKEYGIDVKNIEIQSDNGAEFHACGRNKYQNTPFEKAIEYFGAKTSRIPPRSPTFNSDVETFHRLGEDEFWAVEDSESRRDLQEKLYTYLIDFNFIRTCSYKENKTPWQLLHEDYPLVPKNVLKLPPLVMDHHLDLFTKLNPDPVLEVTKRTGRSDPLLEPELQGVLSRWGQDVWGLHINQN